MLPLLSATAAKKNAASAPVSQNRTENLSKNKRETVKNEHTLDVTLDVSFSGHKMISTAAAGPRAESSICDAPTTTDRDSGGRILQ